MTVLIVEDHPLYAQSLSQYCLNKGHTVAWAKSFEAFTESTTHQVFDLILVDLMLNSGYDGFDICEQVRRDFPKTKVIIISTFDEPQLLTRAQKMKVDGFIAKSADLTEITEAINTVMKGQIYYSKPLLDRINRATRFFERNKLKLPSLAVRKLTEREREIIECIVTLEHNDESVAKALDISAHTVRDHKKKIYNKLGVHDIVGLVKFYYTHIKKSK